MHVQIHQNEKNRGVNIILYHILPRTFGNEMLLQAQLLEPGCRLPVTVCALFVEVLGRPPLNILGVDFEYIPGFQILYSIHDPCDGVPHVILSRKYMPDLDLLFHAIR